jgi:PRTRC genetic system protein C
LSRKITKSLIDIGPIRPRLAFTKKEKKMSTLKAESLLREFHYNGIRIPDPGPDLTVEQVRDLLTPQYPEIATASVSGPEASGSALRYTFSRAIGTKG